METRTAAQRKPAGRADCNLSVDAGLKGVCVCVCGKTLIICSNSLICEQQTNRDTDTISMKAVNQCAAAL